MGEATDLGSGRTRLAQYRGELLLYRLALAGRINCLKAGTLGSGWLAGASHHTAVGGDPAALSRHMVAPSQCPIGAGARRAARWPG